MPRPWRGAFTSIAMQGAARPGVCPHPGGMTGQALRSPSPCAKSVFETRPNPQTLDSIGQALDAAHTVLCRGCSGSGPWPGLESVQALG